MLNIGFPELILILVLALVIFGPSKLPEVGSAVGKAMKEFKKATSEFEAAVSVSDTTSQPSQEQAQEQQGD